PAESGTTGRPEAGPPVLSVTARRGLAWQPGALSGVVDAPPPAVTVTSSAGGSDTATVTVVA
ncbi:MAG: hypothetical protein ACOC84_04410, partial [Actinomycetota bacterium]